MTTKAHMKTAAMALVPLLIVYAMTAFVLWETNPGAWSESARFFFSMLGLMASGIAVAAYHAGA